MVIVAIAGGGGGIGSNIVNAIHQTNKHKLIVLSRSDRPSVSARGIEVRLVNYSSIESLKDALHDVNTVISCLTAYGTESISAQLNLVDAAKQAGAKRFVPSEWATDCGDIVEAYGIKEPIWRAVKESGMEYTRFIVGLWMNVWGVGAPRNQEEALSGYKSVPFILNLRDTAATFPEDGSQQMVFTAMQDIGRFVAATLDLPKWEPDSRIVGERISGHDLVQLAEQILGKDIQVTRVSEKEILSALENPDLSSGYRFYYQLLKAIQNHRISFEPTLNELFPEIKPMSASEYLSSFWSNED